MDLSLKILVVILSSALAIFLILAIMATVKVIQILHSLKHVAEQAEKLAESAEAVGEFVRKSAAPLAFGRFMSNITEAVKDHHKAKEKS